MTPVDPGRRSSGEDGGEHEPDATRALWISTIDFRWPPWREPFSLMTRSTFSTTTMASSTRRPMARTMANMVSMLME